MPDCPPDYEERGSFTSAHRTVRYRIEPHAGRFRCEIWSDDRSLDKVAHSDDYAALWSAARELAWAWLER